VPSSFYDAIPLVLAFVTGLRPASVLDVGVGFGKYGLLFREYLDVDTAPDGPAPFLPAARRVRIDGIEAHPPYVTELQRAIYDTIHVGEALAVLPGLPRYDVVFAADVLEHFTREEGERFLTEAGARAARGVLIVTPALDIEQSAVFGNAYETHRSFWAPADFAGRPHADVLVWRHQLVAWLPTDGRRRRLSRPGLRESLGMAVRAALGLAIGEVRAEVVVQSVRQRR
jgi:voltage-gated potassium channel Kch